VTDPASTALEIAREVGFDLAGLAPLRPPRDAERFEHWLAAGHHADMGWMERQRERILDPRALLDGRDGSFLVVGLAHARAEVELAEGGRVARYAAGRDYHNVMGRLLRKLRRGLIEAGLLDDAQRTRSVVDAGPVLERSHAAEAGLGFPSKAANLLHPRFGPWFFLGEILLPLELDPTPTPPAGSCGTCTACLDACPTGAILEPGLVDARTCVSYQTIENRGSVPRALRAGHEEWVFGCDVCSEVCPWGSDAGEPGTRLGTHAAVESGGLVQWLGLRDEAEWRARFEGSPLSRPRRAGLARNAAIVLGNRTPSDEGRTALLEALSFDPAEVVREAAAWSLARGFGSEPAVRAAIDAAAKRESTPAVASDMLEGLAEAD
jgi:epoxyqueuosine reductase